MESDRVWLNDSDHQFGQISDENEIEFGVAKCQHCGVECLAENQSFFYYGLVGLKIANTACAELLTESIINEWTNTI